MWILGFDSTASTVTAALLNDGKLVASYSADSATSHSTTLLPAIENLLLAAGIKTKDLSLISCSAGPGSFTGVRIGVASAKGLAAPFDIPCVGVSSLEAMAYMFTELKGFICPVLGARRGNVYAALFSSDGNGNITRLTDDDLVSVSAIDSFVADNIPCTDKPCLYVTGDTVEEVSAVLSACDKVSIKKTPTLLSSPSGYGAAVCGMTIFDAENRDKTHFSGEALVPIYLRKSQAEREKEEKYGK